MTGPRPRWLAGLRAATPTRAAALLALPCVGLAGVAITAVLLLAGQSDPAPPGVATTVALVLLAGLVPTAVGVLLALRLWPTLDRVDALTDELHARDRRLSTEAERRRRAERRARRLAVTDELTQLANRRGFVESVHATARARGDRTLLLLDVDHLARVNDQRGRAAGDEALRRISELLERHTRSGDAVGRIGGEEFAVVTAAPVDVAHRVAERIRVAVAGDEGLLDAVGGCTVSIGIAVIQDSLDDAMAHADAALARARRAGRNRVVVAEDSGRPGAAVPTGSVRGGWDPAPTT